MISLAGATLRILRVVTALQNWSPSIPLVPLVPAVPRLSHGPLVLVPLSHSLGAWDSGTNLSACRSQPALRAEFCLHSIDR